MEMKFKKSIGAPQESLLVQLVLESHMRWYYFPCAAALESSQSQLVVFGHTNDAL